MADPLEEALRDLGRHIAVPDVPDLAAPVCTQVRTVRGPAHDHHRRQAWRWAVVAAAVALAVLVAAIPGPRRAVARWLGIGGVRVVRSADVPAERTGPLRLGAAMSLDEAKGLVPFDVRLPGSLGGPAGTFFDGRTVHLVWGPGPGLPPVADTGIGLLLSQFLGSLERPLLEKRVGPGTTVEVVDVRGGTGFWIAGGPHVVLYLDPGGRAAEDTSRLAGNTLIWTEAGVTYRLESALGRDAAVGLAHTLA